MDLSFETLDFSTTKESEQSDPGLRIRSGVRSMYSFLLILLYSWSNRQNRPNRPHREHGNVGASQRN